MISQIISVFFPNKCPSCKDVIDDGAVLCDYCFEMLERVNANRLCIKCAGEKNDCECKYKTFNFDGITAPFYNKGVAKSVMYAFKFRRKEHLSEFFAKEMALSVKQNFYKFQFDAVVCVPLSRKSQLKRGYNQSELLGRKIAEILDVPFYKNILICNKKAKPQYKLPLKERAENVKGVYRINGNLTSRTVLLVDDIKTTGATLNECAKQLLLGKADKVYCVTGLISKKGKKNGNRNRN